MRKYYVILMIPLALATRGHAVDANQPAGASASKAAQDNAASIALAAAGNLGDTAHASAVSTNKPAW